MAISIIIPTFNMAQLLPRCVESVLRQDYPWFEVLVVDDGSTDVTGDLLSAWDDPKVRPLRNERNRGLAAALDRGLQHSTGDLIFLLHADCELMSRDFMRRIVGHFADPSIAWVTGSYENHPDGETNLLERLFAVVRDSRRPRASSSSLVEIAFGEGKCDVIRRSLLDELGGIPRDTRWSGEDQLLSYRARRAGKAIYRDPSLAVIQHSRRCGPMTSLRTCLRKDFVAGKTQLLINLRHGTLIANDVFRRTGEMADRGRHALWRMLTGAGVVMGLLGALLGPGGVVPIGGFLMALLIAFVYQARRLTRAAPQFTIMESGLGVLLAVIGSVVYAVGLAWGVLNLLWWAGRGRRPL